MLNSMPPKVFIYALCEPGTRTIRYIGKTCNLKNRFKDHMSTSSKKGNPLGEWLRGLEGKKPNLVVLSEVTSEEGAAEEIRFILAARNSLGMGLVNSNNGGSGPIEHAPETRAAISAWGFGKPKAPEHCVAISKGLKGGSKSPEHCEALSKAYTPERRKALGEAVSGEKNPMFGKTGVLNPWFGKKDRRASSSFLGVSWDIPSQKWTVKISFGGPKYLGRFENEVDAARAYNLAALRFYGPEAQLNFV